MKRELNYFEIDGSYGGNQEWFTNIVMNMGGCAAATACDCCVYLAIHKGMEELYPYYVHALTREDYVKFSQKMKPYIRPRVGGVKKLEWFIDGFAKYIEDVNREKRSDVRVSMEKFSGNRPYEDAREFVVRQIDAGYPIPCLLLRHKNKEKFQDYIWHWFLLVGYEEQKGDLLVKTATYGESDTFSLRELWDVGYEERGGFVQLGTGHF